jgi:hypothetical protein
MKTLVSISCSDDFCEPFTGRACVSDPLGRAGAEASGGASNSITDLAEQEGGTDGYVCRLLPLTCLAPDIVEAILDGRQPKGLRLAAMLGNGPLDWKEQRVSWRFGSVARAAGRHVS